MLREDRNIVAGGDYEVRPSKDLVAKCILCVSVTLLIIAMMIAAFVVNPFDPIVYLFLLFLPLMALGSWVLICQTQCGRLRVFRMTRSFEWIPGRSDGGPGWNRISAGLRQSSVFSMGDIQRMEIVGVPKELVETGAVVESSKGLRLVGHDGRVLALVPSTHVNYGWLINDIIMARIPVDQVCDDRAFSGALNRMPVKRLRARAQRHDANNH